MEPQPHLAMPGCMHFSRGAKVSEHQKDTIAWINAVAPPYPEFWGHAGRSGYWRRWSCMARIRTLESVRGATLCAWENVLGFQNCSDCLFISGFEPELEMSVSVLSQQPGARLHSSLMRLSDGQDGEVYRSSPHDHGRSEQALVWDQTGRLFGDDCMQLDCSGGSFAHICPRLADLVDLNHSIDKLWHTISDERTLFHTGIPLKCLWANPSLKVSSGVIFTLVYRILHPEFSPRTGMQTQIDDAVAWSLLIIQRVNTLSWELVRVLDHPPVHAEIL